MNPVIPNPIIAEPIAMQTGYVTTEGDDLYYEVRGDYKSQPLLFIAGGGGEGEVFNAVADSLADEYKIITYDRRATGRSTRNEPQNFEVSQQSRDAVAVLQAAGETSAFVVGSSSGAVIALDMAKTQPQAIRAVIPHEPPALRVLPDSQKWLRYFANLYQMTYTWGARPTMIRFMLSLGFFTELISRRLRQRTPPPKPTPATSGGARQEMAEFFTKQEMLVVTNYLPDVAAIKRSGVKVIMAAGQWTLDHKLFYGRTAPILAQRLGCELALFPGHHVSYIDQPQEWAARLREVLHQAG